jgi:hypothetical protein
LRTLATLALVAAALASTGARAAQAGDHPPAADNGKPLPVRLGVYLLSVGKFDVASGSYTADFYLTLHSDKDMGEPHIEIMNGRAAAIDKIDDTPTYKQYRVQANLMANLDLRRFPWDEHDLPIVLESSAWTDDQLVFVADTTQTAIDPAVIFVGWNVRGFDGAVSTHSYPVFNEQYSQITYRIHIARLVFISSLKTFLPVLCFLLIAFVSLLVTLERLDSRVGMNTAMLIASVMFHLSITNQLPPSASLTIADKVLIGTYLTIGVSLLLSVLMMRLVQLGRHDAAAKMRERAFQIVPAFAIVSYATVAITSR